ncbi:ferric reductase like transmembrane component-domain-containing protein [Massariosphaeria phaeospora]|uniref:ferric-chelate reductase (NADPH) n=1 Tax=Massariosphaeria phaeospora TaxID=100035 RepID=A0A7C8MN46_9PLEO|nr:ferric reductase like transmembrane component-domain-containing protein [Massariosphaeria phaeospora]
MPPSQIYAPQGWPSSPFPTGTSVGDLPITSPYCTNNSCKAFRERFTDDERKTPLLGLLKYGEWTVWFYSSWIILFTAIYVYHRAYDCLASRNQLSGKPSLNNKTVALFRFCTYRRPDNRLSTSIGLRQISYGTIALLAFATIFFIILPWPQQRYLRERFRFGSPPLSVRCAMIISALNPLVVVLAGKVNLITWMTGVGYEKLNVYHRYVAYIIFCLGTIHTVPHFVAPVQDGGWSMLNKLYANEARELSGTPLYFATFGLAVFSVPWIRKRFYEAFKYVHVFLAVAYLCLFWWHIWGEYMSPYYIYATIASLLFSNIIRIIYHRNLRSFSHLGGFPTTVTHLHGNTTRIAIQVPKSMKWKPGQHAFLRIPSLSRIGNHPFSIANISSADREGNSQEMVFLVRRHDGFTKKLFGSRQAIGINNASDFVDDGCKNPKVLEVEKDRAVDFEKSKENSVQHIEDVNAPATVDAITVVEEEVASPMSPLSQTSSPPLAVTPPILHRQPSVCSFPPADETTESKLQAIAQKPTVAQSLAPSSTLRGSSSTTRRPSLTSFPPMNEITAAKLRTIANTRSTQTSLRAIVDGPYGTHHRPLHKIYDTVLCVAGGSGITAQLPHILALAQRLARQEKGLVLATRRIHLVWIIRDAEWLSWIARDLRTAVRNMRACTSPDRCSFTVDIYVTRSASLAESASPSEATLAAPVSPTPVAVNKRQELAPEDKVFSNVGGSLEKGAVVLPARPRPVLRRLNGGRGLFDDERNFGIVKAGDGDGDGDGGVSVAMHYCRPVMRDVVEGYVSGERAIVMGCGPPSLSAELANTTAALQRRVWNGEMRELKLELETFGW